MSILITAITAIALGFGGLVPQSGISNEDTTITTGADDDTITVSAGQSGGSSNTGSSGGSSGGSGGSNGGSNSGSNSGGSGATQPVWDTDCKGIFIPEMCDGSLKNKPDPVEPTAPKTTTRKPSTTTVTKAAKNAVNKLVLPRPTPMALPDPDNNEWKMLAVGFPVWLYAPSQSVVTNTVVQDGLTIKITATPVSYVFDMGNRDVVSCVRMPRRPVNLSNPMGESPDCGYTYLDPGVYNISLAVTWRIDWSAVGITGSFNHTPSAVFALKPLPIGELHAVIVDTEENI